MKIARTLIRATALAFGGLLGCLFQAVAQDSAADPYGSPDTWLCKPGRQDLCANGNDRSALLEDGNSTKEEWRPHPAALIDCFYVYPTISLDPNGNSSLVPGPGEKRAVEQQFSIFASVCRPFAPMYRQVTLAGLRSVMMGKPMPMDPELGYADVVAAWKHYLKHENQGHGVVLIGHSQGSRMLARLIQREIEGTPTQDLLISAIIPGFNVDVPAGQDIGGAFKKLPLCKSASQTGCVVTYVTFRSTAPPPANARFGRTRTPGMEVACVDPVALSGTGVLSHLPRLNNLLGTGASQTEWTDMATKTNTPFISLPGLLNAKCVNDTGASYLSVTVPSEKKTRRPHDFPGDILANGKALDDWGLHLVDINLFAGNLIEIIQRQSDAYAASKK